MNETHDSRSGDREEDLGRVGWEGATFGIVPHWLLGRVKPSAVVVYLALTTWADRTDGRAFPGVSGICETAHLSEPTVRAAIKELEAVGAVRVESRYRSNGTQTTNNYWLRTTPPTPPQDTIQDPLITEHSYTPQDSGRVQEGSGVEAPKKLGGKELEPVELEPIDASSLRSEASSTPETLATLLAMRIHANGSRKPTVTRQWVTDIDRMHRIDGRSWDEIRGAIEWSQTHEFWASVILSPRKLRAKFDQMRLQAVRDKRTTAATAYQKFMTDEGSIL